MGNFKEEIAKVRAFAFDVDGVFTDGGITVTPEGEFTRTYNSKDGYAVGYAVKKGYPIAIITGGRGRSLEARFKMLKVSHLYMAAMDKVEHLKEFMADHGLQPDEVLMMGDDLPDIEAMKYCGVCACPADASPEVIEAASYVSQFKGGEGCIRDVVEQVLRARGDWAIEKGFNVVPSAL